LTDNTLLIVTADHGEGFGEHGLLTHGTALYYPLIHVPLVFYWLYKEHPCHHLGVTWRASWPIAGKIARLHYGTGRHLKINGQCQFPNLRKGDSFSSELLKVGQGAL
jgi:hypothetical protein